MTMMGLCEIMYEIHSLDTFSVRFYLIILHYHEAIWILHILTLPNDIARITGEKMY